MKTRCLKAIILIVGVLIMCAMAEASCEEWPYGGKYKVILSPYPPHTTEVHAYVKEEDFMRCMREAGKIQTKQAPPLDSKEFGYFEGYTYFECDARGTIFDYKWRQKAMSK